MPKKKQATAKPSLIFPEISPKPVLECRPVLHDQILLIDAPECKAYVKFIDSLPLELTPPKKRGEAERVNRMPHPLVAYPPDPHLPSFPYPATARKQNTDEPRVPHSFNSNIRVYKYARGSILVRDPLTGAKSEWTLLVYLTGAEDGIEGGETLFYKEERGKPRETITPPLSRGTALLHR
ncbi:hypothetical protein BDQ17DRAFT_1421624 [Cyathus striatus]|nr:hypothetical protein BDQ17DRAFT_1421624 [Cyathus striatus]